MWRKIQSYDLHFATSHYADISVSLPDSGKDFEADVSSPPMLQGCKQCNCVPTTIPAQSSVRAQHCANHVLVAPASLEHRGKREKAGVQRGRDINVCDTVIEPLHLCLGSLMVSK